MSLRFIDPRAPAGPEDTPYTGALSVDPRGAVRLGLLANGFPDSVPFLEAVGRALETAFPQITTRLWNKGNASITAPDALVQEICAASDGVIAAYGH